VKIIFIGDSGVGKSSVINTFINETPSDWGVTGTPTNMLDMLFKKMKIRDSNVIINVNI
jgi:predicted GTPase